MLHSDPQAGHDPLYQRGLQMNDHRNAAPIGRAPGLGGFLVTLAAAAVWFFFLGLAVRVLWQFHG